MEPPFETEDGSTPDLSAHGTDLRRERFGAPAGLDISALAQRIGATVIEVTPGEYEVTAAGTPALVAALTAWLAEQDLALADLRAGRQTLEDVFVRIMRETR